MLLLIAMDAVLIAETPSFIGYRGARRTRRRASINIRPHSSSCSFMPGTISPQHAVLRTYAALVLSTIFSGVSVTAYAQSVCDFLAVEVVSDALPQYQPWRVKQGGTGMCQFEGELRKKQGNSFIINTAVLGFTQEFKDSAKEATEFVGNVRAEVAKTYKVTPLTGPGFGRESFSYRDEGERGVNGLWWFSHSEKVVVTGTFTPPGDVPLGKSHDAVIVSLASNALAASNKPGMAEEAAQCPYFEMKILAKLLPGKGLKVQQFGEDTCMANNAANAVVMFNRDVARDPISQAQVRQSSLQQDCKNEPLPELGTGAFIQYACTSGAPLAKVRFSKRLTSYEFTVAPNQEPTSQQRADLIALAARAMGAK